MTTQTRTQVNLLITLRALVLCSLVGFLAGCAESGEEATTLDLAVRHVTVIDAVHGARTNQTVLIHDGLITDVVDYSDARSSAASRTVEGKGLFLIPGLWDMHVHVTYEPRLTAAMPALFLSHGITSVRDTGGLVNNVKPVVDHWRDPNVLAPRIVWSGPLLDGAKVVYDGDSRPEIGIPTASAAMAEVNISRLQDAGVDFVKIYEMVAPEIFEALVDAARTAGLPIAAHVPLAMTADTAGPRVDSMEHLRNIELACAASSSALLQDRLRLLAASAGQSGYALRSHLHATQRPVALAHISDERCDVVIASLQTTIQVPTLRLNTLGKFPPPETIDWNQRLAQLPEPVRSEWAAAAENLESRRTDTALASADWSLALVGRLAQANVPIGAGTDTPIGLAIPGHSLHTELERLVTAGLTPLEAIEAATLIPARFMRLEQSMGTIEAGKVADLVLLADNPLDDIRHTRLIRNVIARGQLLEPDLIAKMKHTGSEHAEQRSDVEPR